jgi:2-dehydro-3-deoxygluconokinase
LTVLGSIGEGLIELSLTDTTVSPKIGFGGDAANVCVMAAHLNLRARICGRVGTDRFGDLLLRYWREEGLEISDVVSDPQAPTGLYVNEKSDVGDHRYIYYRSTSAGSKLDRRDLSESFYCGLDALVVTGVTLAISASAAGTAEEALTEARARGVKTAFVLNHRPALEPDIARLRALASQCDIVIGSVEDSTAIFGTSDPECLALMLGGAVDLVLSDGANGASAVFDAEMLSQPAPRVMVKNASGAGDALAGAYLSRRICGDPQAVALAWGVAASSLSVRGDGCAGSYPYLEEVEEQLRVLPAQRQEPISC